ncbi:MAG: oxygen-dependent coproporphyrinogen oxidase [Rickettsiaceae bacterium]|nr:oxygen-dependent coproporphyrinogen oxidase [Rickettsiaceae bacterium]
MNIQKRARAEEWFKTLRTSVCQEFENIEEQYAELFQLQPAKFQRTNWDRPGGGGGEMSIMKGNVFEKVGVNFSAVYGEFSGAFSKEVPGADIDRRFFATGISLVAHMKSPLVPAAHFNTRYIETTKNWFGGGGDMTPAYPDEEETKQFHNAFREVCDKYDSSLYPKFKKECDDYFFLKHRNESRGVGGIFFDYYNTGDFEYDFSYVQDVGRAFRDVYSGIIKAKMLLEWTKEQREYLLQKRGRYVEFNLLYDRGTKFGLMTGGNVEAILMSLPPEVRWP